MIAHGVRHGRTLEDTGRWFGSTGFRQPRLQAQASAAAEIGAVTPLTAGLGLAAAAAHLATFWRPPVPVASDEPTETLPPEPVKTPAAPDEPR